MTKGGTLSFGAGQAVKTIKILDDDGSVANQLTIGDATAREGDGGTGKVTVKPRSH